MSGPFLIRHPDGTEYELTDLTLFEREYAPQGFAIATKDVPHELTIPDRDEIKAAKAEISSATPSLKKLNRVKLNEIAASLGLVDVDQFETKAALIDAISVLQDGAAATANDAANPDADDETDTIDGDDNE